MASTKKKTTTTKTTTKRKTPVRRPTAKKSTRKRSALTSRIGLQREETAFMTFRLTRQTLYWLVLGVIVILFTVWLMKLQADIQDIYDQIDATTAALSTV